MVQDTFLELDSQIQQTLLVEIKKRPQLETSFRCGRCEFCDQILKKDFNSFTKHMFNIHYDLVRENIPNADMIPLECEICHEIIKNDINQMMKHHGEKHYAVLPQGLKEWFDKWKAKGYPRIADNEDVKHKK
jgi:transcription elongation factor Elf1